LVALTELSNIASTENMVIFRYQTLFPVVVSAAFAGFAERRTTEMLRELTALQIFSALVLSGISKSPITFTAVIN
jgi:hypothetical protein